MPQQTIPAHPIASRRILRLALGTTLSMAFSQIINWPISFMAAVFTLLILSLPLPPLNAKTGLKFIIALVLPAYAGILLLPFLEHARWAGILMVVMALYASFYFTARGGSAVLGTFMTIGITLVVTIGSVSADIMLFVINGIAVGAFAGIAFVILAQKLLPDLPVKENTKPAKKTTPAKPPLAVARKNALRALTVVLPLVIIFLFSSSSASYVAVMIKVSSMGQQASAKASHNMGIEQLESTFWGGVGAIIAWQIMSIWPSLLLFCLLIALACLIYGVRIFQGQGMHPRFSMWSYALLTMIILITPAVMDSPLGSDAGAAFYSRLLLFMLIAAYGSIAVAVFDAFWPSTPKPTTIDTITTG